MEECVTKHAKDHKDRRVCVKVEGRNMLSEDPQL